MAFEFAAETVANLEEKYPDERRPREALEAVQAWAAGKIKMRPAQQKILSCHTFAKEIACKEDIAMCHAVGQRVRLSIRPDMRLVIPYTTLLPLFTDME